MRRNDSRLGNSSSKNTYCYYISVSHPTILNNIEKYYTERRNFHLSKVKSALYCSRGKSTRPPWPEFEPPWCLVAILDLGVRAAFILPNSHQFTSLTRSIPYPIHHSRLFVPSSINLQEHILTLALGTSSYTIDQSHAKINPNPSYVR